MFSLQDICRKHLFQLPDSFDEYTLQVLGLYWEKHGSLQRIRKDAVFVQRNLIISINEALRIAASEGNGRVVKLLLSWEGNFHYVIIGALEGDHYDLIHKYGSQIEDYHMILSSIHNANTFEKCHELSNCDMWCLIQNAIKYNMLPILQKHRNILTHEGENQELFEMACEEQKYDIVLWIGQTLMLNEPEFIFDIAFERIDFSLLTMGYSLLFNNKMSSIDIHDEEDLISLLTEHLEKAATKGCFFFMLETLKHGGNVNMAVLSKAVEYNHRKILDYFIRQKCLSRKDIEKLLLVAISNSASKKTLNLLLSYLNHSVKNIIGKIVQSVLKNGDFTIIIFLKKKKINLVEPALIGFINYYYSYCFLEQFIHEFDIRPEKMIKMAARKGKLNMIIEFLNEKYVHKDDLGAIFKFLKNLVCTMKHKKGKETLIVLIHKIYQVIQLETKEKFKLLRFYVMHDATIQFISMYKDCFNLAGFKPFLLECLDIAIKKNYPDMIRNIETLLKCE
ncbi:MGF-505-530-4R [African swine fever virus]|nr:MGF_505/530-4R [African swine fever virus]WAS30472.1 MGF-505-530-4R [African swine fever virus]